MENFLNLKDINLEVRKGEFICVIGDVGAGKSSLFSAINGDMIFVPEIFIASRSEVKRSTEYYKNLTDELLNCSISDAPLNVQG